MAREICRGTFLNRCCDLLHLFSSFIGGENLRAIRERGMRLVMHDGAEFVGGAGLARVDPYLSAVSQIGVRVDLLPGLHEIQAGEYSAEVTARGKPGPELANGARQGINDYTGWFAGDETMAGDYFGYDGPCPPWNDEILHHYVFTLYALDVPRLDVGGVFLLPTRRRVVDAFARWIKSGAPWPEKTASPVSGARLTSGFGMRNHPLLGYSKMHAGIDFGVPQGTPIKAAGSGVVVGKPIK